jgi:hypothetical protein
VHLASVLVALKLAASRHASTDFESAKQIPSGPDEDSIAPQPMMSGDSPDLGSQQT